MFYQFFDFEHNAKKFNKFNKNCVIYKLYTYNIFSYHLKYIQDNLQTCLTPFSSIIQVFKIWFWNFYMYIINFQSIEILDTIWVYCGDKICFSNECQFLYSTVNYLTDNFSENVNKSISKFKGVVYELFNLV